MWKWWFQVAVAGAVARVVRSLSLEKTQTKLQAVPYRCCVHQGWRGIAVLQVKAGRGTLGPDVMQQVTGRSNEFQ